MMEMLLQEKPKVVSFHFGLPQRSTIKSLRNAGIATLATATCPHEAALARDAGIDAIIAQGYEAGGHRGVFDPLSDRELGTFALVQLLVADSSVPIIAAGGIMNGKGIVAALEIDAAGVQLGTAFILCPESSADEAFCDALTSERAHNTSVSSAISGRPARGIVNRAFTDVGGSHAESFMPSYPIPYSCAKAIDKAARKQHSQEFAIQWAGQAAPLARAMPAGKLVETLVLEVERNTC